MNADETQLPADEAVRCDSWNLEARDCRENLPSPHCVHLRSIRVHLRSLVFRRREPRPFYPFSTSATRFVWGSFLHSNTTRLRSGPIVTGFVNDHESQCVVTV